MYGVASDMHAVILTSFEDVLVVSAGRLEHNKVMLFAIECISSMHEHSFVLEGVEWMIPCEEKWEVVNVLPLSSSFSDFSIFLSWVIMRISQSKCKMLKTGNTCNYPCFTLSFWITSSIQYIDVCASAVMGKSLYCHFIQKIIFHLSKCFAWVSNACNNNTYFGRDEEDRMVLLVITVKKYSQFEEFCDKTFFFLEF